jgi:pimeloyl-ACP methyl ester carboxylesterase
MIYVFVLFWIAAICSASPCRSPDQASLEMLPHTTLNNIEVDGVSLFYRTAGKPTNPTILLLHGFPSSSHQYRNLIPLLAEKYHVLAPDFPGFGFTDVPQSRNYSYTFASLTTTVGLFLDALSIKRFSVYIFDYGAPTALRLALQRPADVTAIISQNGNAYNDGLGAFWDPIRKYWLSGSQADRDALIPLLLGFAPTKWQYVHGSPNPENIGPETSILTMRCCLDQETITSSLISLRTTRQTYPCTRSSRSTFGRHRSRYWLYGARMI